MWMIKWTTPIRFGITLGFVVNPGESHKCFIPELYTAAPRELHVVLHMLIETNRRKRAVIHRIHKSY